MCQGRPQSIRLRVPYPDDEPCRAEEPRDLWEQRCQVSYVIDSTEVGTQLRGSRYIRIPCRRGLHRWVARDGDINVQRFGRWRRALASRCWRVACVNDSREVGGRVVCTRSARLSGGLAVDRGGRGGFPLIPNPAPRKIKAGPPTPQRTRPQTETG